MSYDFRIHDDDFNYTSNVSAMWRLVMHATDGVRGLDGLTGAKARPYLLFGIEHMIRRWDEMLALQPLNGWGDARGALDVLIRLAIGCSVHPDAIVSVSC